MSTSLTGARGIGLATQAYDRIREAIIDGAYRPGEPVFENRLSMELGMSRTPVREALQVLARDGFLEIVAARGYFIPRISPDDLRELFELREALEGMAARSAAERATDEDLSVLARLCDEYEAATTWQAWAATGAEFHARIAAASRNRRLTESLARLSTQIEMTRRSELRAVRGRHAGAAQEHRQILAAIAGRLPDEAERQARAHVRASHVASIRRLQGWT